MNRSVCTLASLGAFAVAGAASAQALTSPYVPDAQYVPGTIASTQPGASYTVIADVVAAVPVIERVTEPARQCQIETYGPNGSFTTRPSTGQETRSHLLPGSTEVERCFDTSTTHDVIRGYDVRYRYDGREFTVRLPYDPGAQLPLAVAIAPATR